MAASSSPTDSDLLVLHALRCIGFVELPRVAAATGLAEGDVEDELIALAGAGLVLHERGPFGGWGLTDAGRRADDVRVAEELDRRGARDGVAAAFAHFMVLNPQVLDLCTAWQMRSVDGAMAVNDHRDPAYDGRVLDRLAAMHGRAGDVCADLVAAWPRFERYRVRLGAALDQARAGATAFITDDVESYHSVWFQLHEDLLVTLGRPRH